MQSSIEIENKKYHHRSQEKVKKVSTLHKGLRNLVPMERSSQS
jgi:hypothetical protein